MLMSYVLDGTGAQRIRWISSRSRCAAGIRPISGIEEVAGKGKQQVTFDKVRAGKAADALRGGRRGRDAAPAYRIFKPRLARERMVGRVRG
jgi:hypothetical protein